MRFGVQVICGALAMLALPDALMAQETEAAAPDCSNAGTTLETNECYAGLLAGAEERREIYLAAAMDRYADDPQISGGIAAADAIFSAYVDTECGTVYQYWRSGTIRGIMSLTCRIELVDQRTHNIWQNWLGYMDSTPPLLPEPEPSL